MDPQATEYETIPPLECRQIWGGYAPVRATVRIPGIDVWVLNQPHRHDAGGGDIYYLGLCGHGVISRFIVADVAGHGQVVSDLAGNLLDLMLRYMNTPDQTRLVQELNRAFQDVSRDGRFATAMVLSYDAMHDQAILVNAGHPRPLRYSASRKRWTLLDSAGSADGDNPFDLPLGIIPETDYRQSVLDLAPGDVLIIYTDSLMEQQGPHGGPLGEQGLVDLAGHLDVSNPSALAGQLAEEILRETGSETWNDDLTLLTLHHHADDPTYVAEHRRQLVDQGIAHS